ncbi:hypothetical protein ATI61_105620 [Archangium gephyra]|uniref:Lipoprotein n=1 Tax=Archangium gephyra TaxID=48 RepID=A0AAC8QER3_9BACT|nr:hypothetical protein [Archangium gephyra]AKJ06393.1 Hypothetical protein AA314_08019 [Archangium gephyra]REG32292.1 hypothetical protein ATI61_105620 [Archangium gephyra]
MSRLTRLTILSALTLGLVACGGGAKLGGGEEGAAQAAFQASQPVGRNGNKTADALVRQALASGALTVSVSYDCHKGGKVSWGVDLTNVGQDGTFNYDVTYDHCNEDGKNEYNGKMVYAMRFAIDPTLQSFAFITTMKGRLTIEGEISDFIEADVAMSVELNATSAHSGNVMLVIDGTIKTSEGSHVYTQDTLSILAGELPKA